MNTRDTIREQSRKDPAQLEREIDQQRHHIDEIVQALESRFAPGELMRRVFSAGKDGGGEFAQNLSTTVKNNPVPALITAAGLVWLYAGQNRPAPHSSVTTGESRTHAAGERMHQMREGMSEKLGSARQRTGESMHHAADSARHGARRANEGFQTMLNENPLAVGAMAIAVGAMLGALMPSTRREDELMGETSDRLKEQARHAAKEGRDQVAQAGRDVTRGDGGAGAPTTRPASQETPTSPGGPGHRSI